MAYYDRYRPASTLVLVLTVLLATDIVLSVAGAGSEWLQIQLLDEAASGIAIDDDRATANDLRESLIGIAQFGVNILMAILFLVWIHRANKNARVLGARDMEFTPGWSVGYFFVPIANLFKPYQAVKEIWKASNPEGTHDWREAPASPILGLWWASWLLRNILGQIAFRSAWHAQSVSEMQIATWINFWSDFFEIPAAVLVLLVIRGIHTMQENKFANLGDIPEVLPADDYGG